MLVFTARNVAHSTYFERRVAVAVNIMSIMGPVWVPIFHEHHAYEVLTPVQNLKFRRYVGCPKMRNEGPIVLMMLA